MLKCQSPAVSHTQAMYIATCAAELAVDSCSQPAVNTSEACVYGCQLQQSTRVWLASAEFDKAENMLINTAPS